MEFMKGVVFNLLEEVVRRSHGEDTWDALLDQAGLAGSYTSLGSYPDEDMSKLVLAASRTLAMAPADVLRWFGRGAMPILVQRYPNFFSAHTSTRPFILSVNDIIHPEVRKLYPGAEVPDFDFDTPEDGVLVIGYRSQRRLCALAEGFVTGTADYFGEQVLIQQPRCMLHGEERCALVCTFSAAA